MDNSSDDDDYVHYEGCYESETNNNATLQNNNLEDSYIRMILLTVISIIIL